MAAALLAAAALTPAAVGAEEPLQAPSAGKSAGAEAVPAGVPTTLNVSGVDWSINHFVGFFLELGEADFTVAPNKGDTYDGAWRMLVDGTAYADDDGVVDITGTTLTGDPAILSGLTVTTQYYFLPTEPTARLMWVYTNPTAGPISVTVEVRGNLGSDGATQILDSSSGDAVAASADRWVLSWQGPGPVTPDPIHGYIRYGAGAAVTPTFVTPMSNGNDLWVDNFALTVPAGATRRIVMFARLLNDDSVATAQTNMAVFNSDATMTTAGYWAGLTAGQRAEVVNFAPAAPPATVPTLQEWAMILLAGLLALLGAGVAADRMRARRSA